MATHDDGFFDARVASTYDDDAEMFSDRAVQPVVACLKQLAADGAALEFGVGTGRIALPLVEAGVAVEGIDLSVPMLDVLRRKPGGQHLPVHVGDFSELRVAGDFTLVYLVFNTIMNLTSQGLQVACFENAARHLQHGGAFVVECLVPQLRRLPPGSTRVTFDRSDSHWGIDEYEGVDQRVVSHHMTFDPATGEQHVHAVPFRYVWPSELDLMARIAGLELEARWAGWHGEPFTPESESHVSVWRKR